MQGLLRRRVRRSEFVHCSELVDIAVRALELEDCIIPKHSRTVEAEGGAVVVTGTWYRW
jgi:hypothetical protein